MENLEYTSTIRTFRDEELRYVRGWGGCPYISVQRVTIVKTHEGPVLCLI